MKLISWINRRSGRANSEYPKRYAGHTDPTIHFKTDTMFFDLANALGQSVPQSALGIRSKL